MSMLLLLPTLLIYLNVNMLLVEKGETFILCSPFLLAVFRQFHIRTKPLLSPMVWSHPIVKEWPLKPNLKLVTIRHQQ